MRIDLQKSMQFLKGPEGAPLLLMLPGMACSGHVFREGVPHLIRHFNLLLLHNPGTAGAPINFGQGHSPLDAQHLAQVAKYAAEHVLNTELLAGTPVYVVGHSMGGFVAQILGATWRKVGKLVLMSTSLGGPENDRSFANFWLEMAHAADHTRSLFAMMLPKGASSETVDAVEAFFAPSPMADNALLKHFLCGARFTSLEFIREIPCPTLVIHGGKDRVIPPEAARDMAEQLAHARLWLVPDEGHLVFWQRASVYDRMADFLLGDDTVGDPITQQAEPNIFVKQQNQLWLHARQHITSLSTLLNTWGF